MKVTLTFKTQVTVPIDYTFSVDDYDSFGELAEKRQTEGDGDFDITVETDGWTYLEENEKVDLEFQ